MFVSSPLAPTIRLVLPVPRIVGFLVQDSETVRFFNKDAFRLFSTDEMRTVDKYKVNFDVRSAIDYLITSPPFNTQRDRDDRNRYFEEIFNV